MSHFEPNQQRYIVMRLACFSSPKQVAKDVAELFALDEPPSIARIQYYDPTCAQGMGLDADLKQLFQATRELYKAAKDDIPIATQIGRLTRLQELLDGIENNRVLQAAIIEQAAKEEGGFYVRRPVGGDGSSGGPGTDSLMGMPEDDIDRLLAEGKQRAASRPS